MAANTASASGWVRDRVNARLDFYYEGTRVGHIDSTGITVLGTALTPNVVNDNILFALGTDSDIALVNRASTLNANTALTDVLIGTPVAQALAANSLIISNVTASGDVGLYVNNGGNSLEMLMADASAGTLKIGHGSAGVTIAPNSGAIALTGAVTASLSIKASSATELGISVTNAALTIGSAGSLVIPYLSQTDPAFTDAIGGDVNGAIGLNNDSDSGPVITLEGRVEGSWVSVALSGTLFPARRELSRADDPKYVVHPKQVVREDGRLWVDESVCALSGERIQPGDVAVFLANARRTNGDVHAIYARGEAFLSGSATVKALESRLAKLEKPGKK